MPCRVARHCGATRAVARGSDDSDTALSPEQIASFQEQGCLVDAVLFDDDEVEALHLPWTHGGCPTRW